MGSSFDRLGGIPKAVDDALRALEERWEQHYEEEDARHRRFETRLDLILEPLDALGIEDNGGRNNREPRVDEARGEPVNRQEQRVDDRVAVAEDDSEEEELEPNRVVRYQPQQNHGRRYDDDRESSDFRFQVDIPSFNGCLGIEEFMDWITEVDRFFDYIDTPAEKRVKLVACRLKGGASAWWDRLQSRRAGTRREKSCSYLV